MCYWILTSTGRVISRTTVQHLTEDEVHNQDIMQEIREYHTELNKSLGGNQYIDNDQEFSSFLNKDVPPPVEEIYNPSYPSYEEPYQVYQLPEIDEIGKAEDEQQTADIYDKYLGVEVALPCIANDKQMTRVVKRIKGNDNNPHDVPLYYWTT